MVKADLHIKCKGQGGDITSRETSTCGMKRSFYRHPKCQTELGGWLPVDTTRKGKHT